MRRESRPRYPETGGGRVPDEGWRRD